MNVNNSLLLTCYGAQSPPRATPVAATTHKSLPPQGVACVASAINLPALFRHASVITVFGCIENWQLAWAGRISCTLRLSIGEIPLFTDRKSTRLNSSHANI